MAMKLKMESEFGVDAMYWNIGQYAEDFRGEAGTVTLFGYASEEARKAGKHPLMSATVPIPREAWKPEMGRKGIYEMLRKSPQWAGAEEV